MRWLSVLLAVQIVLGGTLVALAATDNLPVLGGDGDTASAASSVPRAKVNRFNGAGAYASVRRQVDLGPRPAGSAASRQLAERIRRTLPNGRFVPVPGGLRNVVGRISGRDPSRTIVVGAHYDTKDIPGFVGANDGASGVAVMTQLARHLRKRRVRSNIVFIAFDGEEAPSDTTETDFYKAGLRGSRAIAPAYKHARAMILLDFVGEKGLRLPREDFSDAALWGRLRRAARRVGVGRVFPRRGQRAVLDDHIPFVRQGVPSIDLIDFDFPCFHRTCDDLSVVSARSMDAVGESLMELLPTL